MLAPELGTTNLSVRQGEFSNVLNNGKIEFNVRSTDPKIIGAMSAQQNPIIQVKKIIRTNGPDINNTIFTIFK